MGFVLAIMLIIFGYLNHNKEKERLLEFSALKTYKNPFPALWVWIGTNTVAQLGNVIESLVFTLNPELGCKFSTDVSNRYIYSVATNFIATFFMLCLTYYLAIIPTLWIFWTPICLPEVNSSRPSEDYYEAQNSNI